MADKKRAPRIVTPAGIAVYPWLNKPDTKFNPEGVYKISLRVAATEAAPLLEKLEAKLEEAYAQVTKELTEKNKPTKGLKKADLTVEEEENGTVLFKFKMKASGVRKDGSEWSQKPALFDSKGQPLDEDTEVWGGSTVKVAFQAVPYYNATNKSAGISMKLNAVQILKLVKGGGTASSYGFGAEEGDDSEGTPSPGVTDDAGGEDEDF
jgi:hypothetical protein